MKGMWLALAVWFGVSLGFPAVSRAGPAVAPGAKVLDVRISAGGGSGRLLVTIANLGARDVLIPAWQTPVRGLEADLFEVRQGERMLPYVGALVKRGDPGPNDYLTLEAGDAVTAEVDLARDYGLRGPGLVTVQYVGPIRDAFVVAPGAGDKEEVRPLPHRIERSNLAWLWHDGVRQARGEPVKSQDTVAEGRIAYVGCSKPRRTQIAIGLIAAAAIAQDAVGYFEERSMGSRYTTWFGAGDRERHETASANMRRIERALAREPLEFRCDCDGNAYAYIRKDEPGRIHLCERYWTAPVYGTDSKAGTTVHEMSHFIHVADTTDHAYGQTLCRSLAASDPFKALRNADSYEYFAENTPKLP